MQLPETLAGVNVDDVLERLDGNEDLFGRILLKARDELPGTLAVLHACVAEKRFDEGSRCAHTLRGMLAGIGAEQAATLVRQVEEALKREEDCAHSFAALKKEMERLEATLGALKG